MRGMKGRVRGGGGIGGGGVKEAQGRKQRGIGEELR